MAMLFVAFHSTALGIGSFGFLGLIVLARLITAYMELKAKRMRREECRAVRGARAEERIGSILTAATTVTASRRTNF